MRRDLVQFVNQNYINLETFRKTGRPVQTPVWFVSDPRGEIFYVRTAKSSGKVNRIRQNGRVNLMPCGQSGEPLGYWVLAHSREATDTATFGLVRTLLVEKYGDMVAMFEARAKESGQKYTVLMIRDIGE